MLLDGKPLEGKEGVVHFKPDVSKGNASSVSSVGVLQSNGSFSMSTDERPGAPAGWYKVIITATEADANPNDETPRVVPERYEKEATTPLTVEVVANPGPGAYDLKLSP